MNPTNNTPQDDASSPPVVPELKPARKPINTVMIAVWALIGIMSILALANIGRLFKRSDSASVPKSKQILTPSTMDPRQIDTFKKDQTLDIARLQDEQRKAAEELKRQAEEMNAATPAAKCGPQLAGFRSAAADGTRFVCGTDGLWHPDLGGDASGIPPMTQPQQQAVSQAVSQAQADALDEAKRKRAEKLKREQDALNASTVAVDFTAQNQKPVENADASEKAPAAAQERALDEIQRPIDLSDKPVSKDASEQDAAKKQEPPKKVKYDWDRFTGKTYKIFEGAVFETVLTNRINGSFAGPIDVMLTTDVYSHDHQMLLIPQGTRCLGSVSAVNSTNQQRLFVAFHRCIMPDGYSLDLDQFKGLNQIGETGLRDLVNHHYVSIFGASLAVGAIGGLAQIGNTNTGLTASPSAQFRTGISEEMSQESLHILDRFLNQLPTFVIRERSRVRVYLSGDLEVPAYSAHELPPNI